MGGRNYPGAALKAVTLAIWIACVSALVIYAEAGWLKSLPAMFHAGIATLPFNLPGFSRASGSHLLALVQISGFSIAALGAGGAGRLIGIRHLPVFIRLAFGFGFIALLNQGLGFAGLLFPSVLALESGIFFIVGLAVLHLTRPWRNWHLPTAGERFPAALLALLLAASFMLARIPDTQEDALNYHFAAPEHFLLLHKINAEPQHLMWHSPLSYEMILTAPWSFGGMDSAKLANIAFLLITLCAIARIASSFAGTISGWWAVFLFASAGLVSDQCMQGKNDLIAAMFLASAGWCALQGFSGTSMMRWLTASAWLAGCAVSVKVPAGFAAAGLMAGLALFFRRSFNIKILAMLAFSFCIPVSGWLAENWLFLGNPFHPFLSGIFPDLAWTPALSEALWKLDLVLGSPGIRWDGSALTGLWRVFGSPEIGSFALIGLLPLALLTLRTRPARLLATATGLAYLFWLLSPRNPRFLFPALAWTSALAGTVAAGLSSRSAPAGRTALAGLAATLALLGAARFASPTGWLVPLGQVSAADFQRARFSIWDDARTWINSNLTASARIRFTGEERRVGFLPRIRSFHIITEPLFWRLTRDSSTVAEMRKRVRQYGLTHHLHNFVSAEYRQTYWYTGPDWSARQLILYRDFVRAHYRPIYSPPRIDTRNGGIWVFEITPRPSQRGYPVHFLPFTEGRFAKTWHLLKEGRLDEAAREARNTAAGMPGVDQAVLVLATVEYSSGRYKEAARLLDISIRNGFISIWDGSSYGVYGASLANSGRLDEGIKFIARNCLLLSEDSRNLEVLGNALVTRGQARAGRGLKREGLRDLEAAYPLLSKGGIKPAVGRMISSLGGGFPGN